MSNLELHLYILDWPGSSGVDCYTDVVVAAPDGEAAVLMHPRGDAVDWELEYRRGYWARSPDQVTVKHIGEAADHICPGIVSAPFRPG